MPQETTTSIKINQVEIVCTNNESEVLVPIKPICQALGIAYEMQYEVIKSNPVFGSTIMLNITVGADGKDRDMLHLPLKYVFGWLMGINANKVKAASKEAVMAMQMEAYNVLYEHFFLKPIMQEKKLLAVQRQQWRIAELEASRKDMGALIKQEKEKLAKIWDMDATQLELELAI